MSSAVVHDVFVAFSDVTELDVFIDAINSAHKNITVTRELECSNPHAYLHVLTEKCQDCNTNDNVSETNSFWTLYSLGNSFLTTKRYCKCGQ